MATIHYPVPLHLQEAHKYLNYKKGDFPIAEKVCGELISIPMNPFLTKLEVEEICVKINKIVKGENK